MRKDRSAAILDPVEGAIFRSVAAANAVDTLIGLDNLNKGIVLQARGARGTLGIDLCALIVRAETEQATVDSTGRLGVPDRRIIITLILMDYYEVFRIEFIRESSRTGNVDVEGSATPRDDILVVIVDWKTAPAGHEETDIEGPHGHYVSGYGRCRNCMNNRGKSQDKD